MALFRCDREAYKLHYGGSQTLYFKGMYTQRGYGNILGTLMRAGIPLVKTATGFLKSRAGRELGKDALLMGSKIVRDATKGKKAFKASVKKHRKEVAKTGFQALLEARKLQRGQGVKSKLRRVDILDDDSLYQR